MDDIAEQTRKGLSQNMRDKTSPGRNVDQKSISAASSGALAGRRSDQLGNIANTGAKKMDRQGKDAVSKVIRGCNAVGYKKGSVPEISLDEKYKKKLNFKI